MTPPAVTKYSLAELRVRVAELQKIALAFKACVGAKAKSDQEACLDAAGAALKRLEK